MHNLWNEIRNAVQLYSDSFFSAVELWKEYRDIHLIKNRLQLCEAMHELLHEYTIHDTTFVFSLCALNNKAVDTTLLIPEVQPYFGNEFVTNGDILTFGRIEESMDKEGFKLMGLFFQNILLRGLAGFDTRTMQEVNADNRASLLSAFQLILRVPESCGAVHIRINNKSKPRSSLRDYKLKEIQSMDGLRLFQYLASFQPAHPMLPGDGNGSNFTTPPPQTKINNQTDGSSRTRSRSEQNKRQRDEAGAAGDSSPTPPSSAINTSSSSDSPVPKHRRVSKTTPRLQPPHVPPVQASVRAVAALSGNGSAEATTLFTPPRGTRHAASDSLHRLTTTATLLHSSNSSSTDISSTTHRCFTQPTWSTEHPLVGKDVAAMRTLPNSAASGNSKTSSSLHTTLTLRFGRVIAAAMTATNNTHHASAVDTHTVFQVEWDALSLPVEELTLSEVLERIHTYNETEGWATTHSSVGTLVAAVFPRQGRKVHKELRGKVMALGNEDLFLGKVVKYQSPDELYHIEWCDGDSEDYGYDELKKGVKMYEKYKKHFSSAGV